MSLQTQYNFATGDTSASAFYRNQIAQAISTQMQLWLTTPGTANQLAWCRAHVGQEQALAAQIAPQVDSNGTIAGEIPAAIAGTPVADSDIQFVVDQILEGLAG